MLFHVCWGPYHSKKILVQFTSLLKCSPSTCSFTNQPGAQIERTPTIPKAAFMPITWEISEDHQKYSNIHLKTVSTWAVTIRTEDGNIVPKVFFVTSAIQPSSAYTILTSTRGSTVIEVGVTNQRYVLSTTASKREIMHRRCARTTAKRLIIRNTKLILRRSIRRSKHTTRSRISKMLTFSQLSHMGNQQTLWAKLGSNNRPSHSTLRPKSINQIYW